MALGEETYRRNASWPDTYNELKSIHDEAYKKIDEALKYDEEGQKDKAFASYDQGLLLLDKALAVNIECPSSPDLSWERACCMVDKMRKTRKEILSRVADTQVQVTPPLRPPDAQVAETLGLRPAPERPEDLALEPPPSYDEAMATSPSSSASNLPSLSSPPTSPPRTYGELGEVLQTLKVETNMQSVKVMLLVDGVRVYYISPDGSVSAPSQPTQLRVLELEDGREEGLPKYFLQVGEWFYPLVPDVSPCFRSDYGAFILPDVQSKVEGSAVGLILPPEADISLFELLEDVLHGVVSQPPTAPPRTRTRRDNLSNTISKGIVSGAHYVSTGLIKGAEAASNYVSSTTPKIISKLSPEEPRPVPPSVRTGAKVARTVTHTAVNVTGFVGNTAENEPEENDISEDETVTETSTKGLSKIHKRHRHKHRRHLKLNKEEPDENEVPEDETCIETSTEGSSERHKRHRHKHRRHFSKHSKEEPETNEISGDEILEASEGSSERHKRHRRHLSKLSKEFSNKLKIASTWQPLARPRVKYGKNRATATFLSRDGGSTTTDKKTGKVGSATMALGRYLAPHVQRGGTKLLAKVGVAEEKASEGVGGVLTVAAGAVEGFGTIYSGLEQSANMLGSSLANNTVKIVQHKYGEPMAEVTGNTLFTVGNVYNTTNNISNLTPKGLAKRTAKNTGKALVESHRPDINGSEKSDFNATDKPSTSKEK